MTLDDEEVPPPAPPVEAHATNRGKNRRESLRERM
jgi:hypothetical protein